MGVINSQFRPALWLQNPHAQTLFASKLRPSPPLAVGAERLELDDGDFLDLSWLPERGQPDDAPVVIVLHGLNGGLDSKYARGLLRSVAAHNARGVLLHFRGASKPNRLSCSYHSGQTRDLATVIAHVQKRYPHAALTVVGYSLGANVLLKYLGEQAGAAPLTTAVAVSVPFDLAQCADAINHGLSRLYRAYLLKDMRTVTWEKFKRIKAPVELPDLRQLRTFESFDSAVTAPLNGFKDAQDYYAQSSSGPYLRSIRVPTLVIQATDDPFMGRDMVPSAQTMSSAIHLELSARGGHVGFVAGDRFGRPVYWLEQRIPQWLEHQLPGFALPAGSGGLAHVQQT